MQGGLGDGACAATLESWAYLLSRLDSVYNFRGAQELWERGCGHHSVGQSPTLVWGVDFRKARDKVGRLPLLQMPQTVRCLQVSSAPTLLWGAQGPCGSPGEPREVSAASRGTQTASGALLRAEPHWPARVQESWGGLRPHLLQPYPLPSPSPFAPHSNLCTLTLACSSSPADEMTVGKVYAALMIFDFYKQNKTSRDQIHQAPGGLSQVLVPGFPKNNAETWGPPGVTAVGTHTLLEKAQWGKEDERFLLPPLQPPDINPIRALCFPLTDCLAVLGSP